MSNLRTLILRKPGHVVFDGVTFFSSAPIEVELMEDLIELEDDRSGKFDDRPTGRMVSVKFTPQQFTSTALAKLYPFGSLALGASIFGATDKTLDIHTTDGERYRIPCAAVYAEPESTWGVSKPILGQVEFRGIVGDDASPAALASYFSKSSTAYPGNTAWDPSQVKTPSCAYSWPTGSATAWDDIHFVAPPVIKTEAKFEEDRVEGAGLVNIALVGYKVTLSGEMSNISPDLMLAELGWGEALGSSKSALGRDFKIDATGAYARLKNAVMKAPANARFSAKQRLFGQVTFEALATYTSGAKNALFSISTTDPDA